MRATTPPTQIPTIAPVESTAGEDEGGGDDGGKGDPVEMGDCVSVTVKVCVVPEGGGEGVGLGGGAI